MSNFKRNIDEAAFGKGAKLCDTEIVARLLYTIALTGSLTHSLTPSVFHSLTRFH